MSCGIAIEQKRTLSAHLCNFEGKQVKKNSSLDSKNNDSLNKKSKVYTLASHILINAYNPTVFKNIWIKIIKLRKSR